MEWGGAGPGGLRRSVTRSRKQTASRAWLLWTLWFDTVFRGLQTGSPRTGGDGEGAPRIGRKVGCCWLCGSTRPAERLWGGSPRTGWGRRGIAPRIARASWVLGTLWFDTTVRRLPVGSPRTGWGRRLARRLGCRGLCGSTRPSEDSRSAHHERGGADDWLGRLGVEGCVVRHDRPNTAGRLTTNGVGAADRESSDGRVEPHRPRHPSLRASRRPHPVRGETIGSEAWVPGPVWFDTTVRRLPVGSPRTG